jgi:hypothetical protein
VYWYLFYQKQRQMYLKLCQEYSDRFISKVKSLYDVQSTQKD